MEVPCDDAGEGHVHWQVPPWDYLVLSAESADAFGARVQTSKSFLRRCADFLWCVSRVLGFLSKDVGREHGIGIIAKLRLLRRIHRGHRGVRALSTLTQHMTLVEEVLRVPPSVDGSVVECGCYNGAASISLSLACAATNRALFVCDSFEGLPDPARDESWVSRVDGSAVQWVRGDYASEGSLNGVKRNIARWGEIDVCRFVKGYFADTLGDLETDSIVLVFEDADIVSSVQDCIKHLWPKMQFDCKFYCHEPWAFEVVSIFFDRQWWKDELGARPPGFVGSGCGELRASGLGYAQKPIDAT